MSEKATMSKGYKHHAVQVQFIKVNKAIQNTNNYIG